MPKTEDKAASVYGLWYFIIFVKCVTYKYTVKENYGSFLAAAR